MMNSKKTKDADVCQVIPIIFYQETCVRYLICKMCETQTQELVCVSMRPQNMECSTCLATGYMVGQRRQD